MRRVLFILLLLLVSGCGGTSSPTPCPATAPPTLAPPTETPLPQPTAEPPPPTVVPSTVEPTAEVVAERPPLAPDALRITILYDNVVHDVRLRSSWGFAALIEFGGHTLLFDTGGDEPTLSYNMEFMGVDPGIIEAVVLSHIHGDHVGGIGFLRTSGIQPPVYVPPSFPRDFREDVGAVTEVVDVTSGQEFFPGIYTTGELLPGQEQSLVIRTEAGLVVVTGCAHPGIVEIVTKAKELFDEPVLLVLGGFHLGQTSNNQVREIIADFRRLGVQQVSPSHCTGAGAMALFANSYGDDYIEGGLGYVFIIE